MDFLNKTEAVHKITIYHSVLNTNRKQIADLQTLNKLEYYLAFNWKNEK